MAIETCGIEILSRSGKSYSGRWSIKGADISISIIGMTTKTVPIGACAGMPRGLVRRIMVQMLDRFETQRRT